MKIFSLLSRRGLRFSALAVAFSVTLSAQIANPTLTLSPGSQFSLPAGSQAAISASASAFSGRTVKQVEFFVDGASASIDARSPYGFLLTGPAVGAHALLARVTDSADVTTDVSVAFETTTPYSALPQVSLQIPANGSSVTVGSVLYLAASASDSDGGIQSVSFFVDGSLVGTDSSAPYSSVTLPNNPGTALVTAVAKDNAGNTVSATATVNVLGVAQSVPSILLTKPSESGVIYAGQPFLFEAIANPGDGSTSISAVNFTVNGSQLTGEREGRQVGFSNLYRVENLVFSTPGTYVVSAVATDSKGVQVQSSIAQTLTVAAPQGAPPTVSILQPANTGTALTLTSLTTTDLVAFASDADGSITSVEFFVDRGTRASATASLSSETTGTAPNQVTRRFVSGVTLTNPGAGYLVIPQVVIASGSGSGASAGVTGFGSNGALSGVNVTNGGSGYTDATVRFVGGGLFERTSLGAATMDGANGTWRLNISPGLLGSGPHQIYAIARDNAGNLAVSAELAVQIVGATSRPPTVSLVTSSTVGKVGFPVSLTAQVTDPEGGVSRVDFFANGSLLSTDTAAPFTYAWTPTGTGDFVVQAVAVDATGNSTRSKPITVTIGSNSAPTATIRSPLHGAVMSAGTEIEILVDATDADGTVASVEFFVNGTSIGVSTNAPFSLKYTPGVAGRYEFAAVATDATGQVGTLSPTVSAVAAFNARPSPLVDAAEFISTTFSDLAGRFPSDEELEDLVAAFNAGIKDRKSLMAELFKSPYFKESVQLTMLYKGLLGVWPTPVELEALRTAGTTGNGSVNIGDDHGNGFTTATPLTAQTTAGILETFGDVDAFSFNISTDNTLVTLRTLGGTDTVGELYDSTGNLIASNDQSGSGNNFQIIRALNVGTYYIAVRGFVNLSLGSYTLEAIGPTLGGTGVGNQTLKLSAAVSALVSSDAYTQTYGTYAVATDAERRVVFTQFYRNLYGAEPSLQQIQLGSTAIFQLGAPTYFAAVAAGDKITINSTRVDPITNAPNISLLLQSAVAISANLKIRPVSTLLAKYETLDAQGLAAAILGTSEYVNRFITIVAQPRSQTVALGGVVELSVDASGAQPMTYQWYRDGAAIAGARSPIYVRSNAGTADGGVYAVEIRNSIGSIFSPSAIVTVGGSGNRLANLSTRGITGPGGDALIAGFVVAGAPRPFLIRAAGPTLTSFGVTGVVADPSLELLQGRSVIATNNNWGDGGLAPAIAAATAQVGGFAFATGNKEAALLVILSPGAYSAVVGSAGESANTLVEVYDVTSPSQGDRLLNVATRGRVGQSTSPSMIGGFVVQGTATSRVLIRAIGPALARYGVGDAASDVRVVVRDASGVLVGANDNWEDTSGPSLAASAASIGTFALDAGSKDAALELVLPGGAYTAEVTGVNGATGAALIEIYQLP